MDRNINSVKNHGNRFSYNGAYQFILDIYKLVYSSGSKSVILITKKSK